MHPRIAAELQADPLFAACTPTEQARLLAATSPCTLKAGDRLFEAGAQARHYYWIRHGKAVLESIPSRIVGPRCSLGTEAFADGSSGEIKYLFGAHALTRLSLLRIDCTALRQVLETRPQLRSDALLKLASTVLGERRGAPADEGPPLANDSLPVKAIVG